MHAAGRRANLDPPLPRARNADGHLQPAGAERQGRECGGGLLQRQRIAVLGERNRLHIVVVAGCHDLDFLRVIGVEFQQGAGEVNHQLCNGQRGKRVARIHTRSPPSFVLIISRFGACCKGKSQL